MMMLFIPKNNYNLLLLLIIHYQSFDQIKSFTPYHPSCFKNVHRESLINFGRIQSSPLLSGAYYSTTCLSSTKSSSSQEQKHRKNKAKKRLTSSSSNNEAQEIGNNKNKKKKSKVNQQQGHRPSKRRHSKEEVNDIIKSIGLTPVEVDKGKNKKNNSKPSVQNKQSNNDNHDDHDKNNNIPIKTQLQYARNGHASLRSIIPTSIIKQIKQELIQYSKKEELNAWKQKVEVATKSMDLASSCTSVDECKSILLQHQQDPNTELTIPFLQHFNTWQSKSCPTVHKLVTSSSSPLPNIASQLLDVPSIRLYQDSLFHKRTNDGPTPWHSDARMAPFDTSHMITIWIPLDYIPKEEDGGTGLLFVDKSHVDFALPFWNPVPKCDGDDDSNSDSRDDEIDDVYARLEDRYGGEEGIKHYMPLELGDCTVHAGWTLHCANGIVQYNDDDDNNGNESGVVKDRYALAVTYVDAKAEIRREIQKGQDVKNTNGHHEDRQSFRKWIDEVPPRTPYFEHPLVPIVWPKEEY